MVHALKPNPKSHIQEKWRIFDFFSHHPESLHMFTYLFDDVGIPQDYRHMDGSGVNTYTLINRDGKVHYVKFHWRPTCGVKCLLDDEAVMVGGKNHSHATKDLYDAIAAGNYPEWKLYIQTIDRIMRVASILIHLMSPRPGQKKSFPLQSVGHMVLNKNIDNFFAENEQLAFCPAIIVPGIYYSDDKLLQTRIFSYADTQRHRLGPNYLMLPPNAPKNAHHNNHHEGFMNFFYRDEETIIHKENNFKQPERDTGHGIPRGKSDSSTVVDALSDPRVTHEIRSIWISYWSQSDRSLGQNWRLVLVSNRAYKQQSTLR
ncbi:hypothetical protein HPP92_021044 [Vanilla planifolia]|uniref:catalase n=1 Tax=Vanilla planifolia TaxID=51239 RepID=A0A835UGG0_VANPL|nr:hypothetical protein HPP92_021044 [Vanilla planifolia]